MEQNYENHRQYQDYHDKARAWMEEAKQIIRDCSDTSGNREVLQSQLETIQGLMQKQDAGGHLVHLAVSWGEKAARTSRPDTRDEINKLIGELQTDWDRLVKKMSNAKVALESSLLQWADYSSSYQHLKNWLGERETRLHQELNEPRTAAKASGGRKGLGEKRAALRKTNSFVMDIVSIEPMIDSVSAKASELLQKSPASTVASDASEIAQKYRTLSTQAKELLDRQRQLVEQHQSFTELSQEFLAWLRMAREKLSKCSEPIGDRESLRSKIMQIKVSDN